jgi:hypothetical protein
MMDGDPQLFGNRKPGKRTCLTHDKEWRYPITYERVHSADSLSQIINHAIKTNWRTCTTLQKTLHDCPEKLQLVALQSKNLPKCRILSVLHLTHILLCWRIACTLSVPVAATLMSIIRTPVFIIGPSAVSMLAQCQNQNRWLKGSCLMVNVLPRTLPSLACGSRADDRIKQNLLW